MKFSQKITAISTVLLLTFLTSCVETVVVGSVAAGVVVTREKSVSSTQKDVRISAAIVTEFVKNGLKNPGNFVDVMVNEGRVLLTGSVADPQKAKLAQVLAWNVAGVKEVIDEVQLNAEAWIKLEDVSNIFTDHAITAEAETKLFFERHVSSRNYKITTSNRVTYLLGVASSNEEVERALAVISKIRGVEKVVNHVILKNDPRRNG